jgi:hypothetical protein
MQRSQVFCFLLQLQSDVRGVYLCT